MRSDFAFLLKKSNRPVRCFLSTSRPSKGPSFFGRFLLDDFFAGLLAGVGCATTSTSPLICSCSLRARASSASTSCVGGVDLTVGLGADHPVLSMVRCGYANNEPVKEGSERKATAALSRDLKCAFGAERDTTTRG